MTAEIIIMNKQAVALAADSAVTFGSKVYYSANKVFALSKYHPVGIMIYGNANLMDVPWEIIIKNYRQNLSDKRFDKLSEYAVDFVDFIERSKLFFPEQSQIAYIENAIVTFLEVLNKEIKQEIDKTIEIRKQIGKREIKKLIKNVIDSAYRDWKKVENIKGVSDKDIAAFVKKYSSTIHKILSSKYKPDILTREIIRKLEQLCAFLFLKLRLRNNVTSGVVVAGYGNEEIFPSYNHIKIEAYIDNRLKYSGGSETAISFQQSAVIEPFAQSEMVGRFIRGVDADLNDFMDNYLSSIFQNFGSAVLNQIPLSQGADKQSISESLKRTSLDIYKKYQDDLLSYIRKHNIDPIINMVTVLPKDELALMAEALVNLTSFKRKVSDESETVGGPIDVAVISKGDGFVWIKRKHYFNSELNHSFFDNYYRK